MGAMMKVWGWGQSWEELGSWRMRRVDMSSPQRETEPKNEMFNRGMPILLRLHLHHGAQGLEPEPVSICSEGGQRGNAPVHYYGEEGRAPIPRLRAHSYQHSHLSNHSYRQN